MEGKHKEGRKDGKKEGRRKAGGRKEEGGGGRTRRKEKQKRKRRKRRKRGEASPSLLLFFFSPFPLFSSLLPLLFSSSPCNNASALLSFYLFYPLVLARMFCAAYYHKNSIATMALAAIWRYWLALPCYRDTRLHASTINTSLAFPPGRIGVPHFCMPLPAFFRHLPFLMYFALYWHFFTCTQFCWRDARRTLPWPAVYGCTLCARSARGVGALGAW